MPSRSAPNAAHAAAAPPTTTPVARRATTAVGLAALLLTTGVVGAGASASSATSSGTAAGVATSVPVPAAVADVGDGAYLEPIGHPGLVVGRLVNAAGAPIEGALVETLRFREVPESGILAERTERRTWTDARGRFRVRQSSDGYLLRACFPDPRERRVCRETAQGVPYLGTYLGPQGVTNSWVAQTSLFPSLESDRRVGVLTAASPSAVRGRLSGAAFAEVRIMRLNDTMAFRTWADAEGRYRFRGMAPGPYYLAAGGQGALPWRSPVFDLKPASTYRLEPASLRRGAVLAGVVTNGAGRPAPGVELLVRREGSPVAATTTDENGAFRLSGFTKGGYEVSVEAGASRFEPIARRVDVTSSTGQFDASLIVRRGAQIVVPFTLEPGDVGTRVRDELRDAGGVPILANHSRGGKVTYAGLEAGRYTVVAGTSEHYATRNVRVEAGQRKLLGSVALDTPTLTLRGRTAPRAVAEATTGDLCPPGGDGVRYGGFHSIEKADSEGRYRLTGLVPGTLMLGADGWPGQYAPRCWSGYQLTESSRRNLPLVLGATVRGRLVYADTGTPVITNLSYELVEGRPSATSPTDEHPGRARAARNGRFEIPRLSSATMTGRLAQGADTDRITSLRFLVIHPFQDGTPYWLASAEQTLEIQAGQRIGLGEIPLVLHPTTADR